AASEVTPELLRAAILRNGCLLIRGLVDRESAARIIDGVDRAYAARESAPSEPGYYEEFVPDPRFDLSAERGFISGGAGLWGPDSPSVLGQALDAVERAGLRQLASDYLGERPAISINKLLLRKVDP